MQNENQTLDLSYLRNMLDHNPKFMIEVIDTFIEQTPFYLAELEDALLSKNWDSVGNCAHKIKPTFSYIGRNDVKDFIQTIEDKARSQIVLEQITLDVAQLKGILVVVYKQLEVAKKEIQLSL